MSTQVGGTEVPTPSTPSRRIKPDPELDDDTPTSVKLGKRPAKTDDSDSNDDSPGPSTKPKTPKWHELDTKPEQTTKQDWRALFCAMNPDVDKICKTLDALQPTWASPAE